MAVMEYGQVDAQELQSSLANVSLDDGDELVRRRLEYDLSVRLIVALQIQKLKLDIKKDVDVYGSLLCDLDGESDRLRRRVAANRMAREELDVDDDTDADDHEKEEEEEEKEEEEETIALKELTDMYVKASGVDDRGVARLWRNLEKELDDRADAVTSGAFDYTYAPFTSTHHSLRSSSVQRN